MTERPKTLGGSDAQRIARGEWLALWMEKTGRAEPVDLSENFQVQLGIYTEPFHLNWIKRVGRFTEMMMSPKDNPFVYTPATRHTPGLDVPIADLGFLHVTPDAVLAGPTYDVPVEVKHSNGRNSFLDAVEYYSPQLQHAMFVMGAPRVLFSVICGNADPSFGFVEYDEAYATELIKLELKFWDFIERDEAPPSLPGAMPVELPAPAALRIVDMAGNNAWAAIADMLKKEKPYADDFERHKGELKELMPADARVAHGYGAKLSRDKRGAIRLTLE